jgi:hypothetical protein
MTSPHACIPSVWAAEISRPACAKSETLRQQTCQVWGVHRYAGSTGVIVVLISAWGKVRSCMKNWKIRWKQKESGQQWLGCNLRTGWDREHNLLRPAGVNSSWDPISKTTATKWAWRCDSSGRVLALWAWSSEFKSNLMKRKVLWKLSVLVGSHFVSFISATEEFVWRQSLKYWIP